MAGCGSEPAEVVTEQLVSLEDAPALSSPTRRLRVFAADVALGVSPAAAASGDWPEPDDAEAAIRTAIQRAAAATPDVVVLFDFPFASSHVADAGGLAEAAAVALDLRYRVEARTAHGRLAAPSSLPWRAYGARVGGTLVMSRLPVAATRWEPSEGSVGPWRAAAGTLHVTVALSETAGDTLEVAVADLPLAPQLPAALVLSRGTRCDGAPVRTEDILCLMPPADWSLGRADATLRVGPDSRPAIRAELTR